MDVCQLTDEQIREIDGLSDVSRTGVSTVPTADLDALVQQASLAIDCMVAESALQNLHKGYGSAIRYVRLSGGQGMNDSDLIPFIGKEVTVRLFGVPYPITGQLWRFNDRGSWLWGMCNSSIFDWRVPADQFAAVTLASLAEKSL